MPFAGRPDKGRVFTMEKRTTDLLTTTHCEQRQSTIICWNVFAISFINAWSGLHVCRCVFCFVFTHLYTCTVCSGSSQGWYIFADSSNGGYGHTTDLLTAPIKITGPQCTLVFWYHMSGFTVGTLQVQLSRNYEYNCYSFAALVTQALKTSKHIVNVTVNFMLHFV